jgi:hypothetical protein
VTGEVLAQASAEDDLWTQTLDYGRLASLAVLYRPSRWYAAVEEAVRLERSVVHRDVHVQLTVPNGDFGTSDIDLRALTVEPTCTDFVVALLWPLKGELLDVRPGDCQVGTELRVMRFATHDEHVDYSCDLIKERLFAAFLPLLLDEDSDIQAVKARLDRVAKALGGIVSLPPDKARAELEKWFKPVSHQLRGFEGPRPQDEHRLYKLCEALCDRYLKLAVVGEVRRGETIHLRWTEHEQFESRRDRSQKGGRQPGVLKQRFRILLDQIRGGLGTTPSQLYLAARMARRTNHYSYRLEAPEDHYICRPVIVTDDDRQVLPPLLSVSESEKTPALSVMEGGGTDAVLFVRKSSFSKSRLSLVASCFEIPPGTTGFALASGVLLALVMAMVVILNSSTNYAERYDISALIVAVVAASGVVAGPLLPRGKLYSAPLTSRLVLILNSAIGLIFAVCAAAYKSTDLPGSFLGKNSADLFRGMWPQVVCLSIVVVTTIFMARRFGTIVSLYRSAFLGIDRQGRRWARWGAGALVLITGLLFGTMLRIY